jgi:hypothetical protein
MGARLSLELSDGLAELREFLADYAHERRVLDPEDARVLMEICDVLRNRARKLENEVSRTMWNGEARRERLMETETVLAAISDPGTNVLLFPVIPRPFSDGQTGGAA